MSEETNALDPKEHGTDCSCRRTPIDRWLLGTCNCSMRDDYQTAYQAEDFNG